MDLQPSHARRGTPRTAAQGLALLHDAARHGTGISPDARHVRPLLALAAALVDPRQLDEAGEILHAADCQTLRQIFRNLNIGSRTELARIVAQQNTTNPAGPAASTVKPASPQMADACPENRVT